MFKTIKKPKMELELNKDISEILKNLFLFKNLPEDQIKELRKISHIEKFKPGETLFIEGDEAKYLNILIKGVLRIYKTDNKGHEVTITYLCPVSLVAEVANLTHINYPASAEFETEGTVIKIDYPSFEAKFLKNPEICFSIVKSLLAKIRVIENAFSENFILDATSRVAKFLYEDEELFNKLKHTKIASLLNLTPETLSRVIKKLKTMGIIEKQGNKYIIKERERLKEFFE